MTRKARATVGVVAGVVAVLLAGCSSSGAPAGTKTPRTSAASSGSALGNGTHPDLSGDSVGFVISSLSPMDTVSAYMLPSILRSWGAKVSVTQLNGSAIASAQAVLAGRADVALEDVGTLIDGHLIALGPSQPRVDYVLASARSITKISQLKGKVVTISDPKGIDGLIMRTEFSDAGVDPNSVQYQIVSSTSQRATALIAGRGSATEIHLSDKVTLGSKLNYLENAASALPKLADSYLGVKASWASANPKLATAVDEAWLDAVREFNQNPSSWIDGAKKYDPTAPSVAPLYSAAKAAGLWPNDCVDGFTASTLTYNESVAAKSGAANSAVPLGQWTSLTYWQAAVKAVCGK